MRKGLEHRKEFLYGSKNFVKSVSKSFEGGYYSRPFHDFHKNELSGDDE